MLVLVLLVGTSVMPSYAAEEVKIGFLSAFTGVFSSFGTLQKEGAIMALEEVDYEVAGKKNYCNLCGRPVGQRPRRSEGGAASGAG